MPKGEIVGNNDNKVVIMEIRGWGLIKCWSNDEAKKVMSKRPKEEKPMKIKNILHEQSAEVACYLSRESKDGYESFIAEE